MIEEKNLAPIGKFQKTHALKGELNAILDIEPDYLEEGNPVVIDVDGIFVPFYAESIRTKGATSFLMKLEGVDSEEQAKEFVNHEIFTPKENLVEFFGEEDAILSFTDDLEGYSLLESKLGYLGKIADIDDSTENVLIIGETDKGTEFFIPFTEDFIVSIDDDKKEIVLDLPDNLIDPEILEENN